MTARQRPARETRVLAKPLIQAGVRREPGDTVELRPDQIARLEPDGYFENEAASRPPKRKQGDGGAS